MSTAGRILKNTTALIIANIVAQAIGLLINLYVARKMGAMIFGQFAFAATFSSYFLVLADPGISTLAQRDLSRKLNQTREYTSIILLLRVGFSAFAFILLFMIAILQFETSKIWLISFYGLAYLSSWMSLQWVFNANEKMEYTALISIVSAIIHLILVVIFIQFTSSLLLFPLAFLFSNLIGGFISILLFWKSFGGLRFLRTDRSFWKVFFNALWPFAISGFVIATYFKLGTIIMGFSAQDSEVGLYNAAYKLILVLQMLGGMYFTSLYPSVSRLYVTSKPVLSHLVTRSVELCASIGFPMLVGGIIIAKHLIGWLYTAEYQGSIVVFQVLLFAVFSTYLSGTFAYILMACDRQSAYLGSTSVALLVSTMLYFLLIPTYGAIGAAIGYVSAEFLSLVLVFIKSKQVIEIHLLRYLVKPMIASGAMGIALVAFSLVGTHWWILVVVSVPVYMFILYIIGGINKEWIQLIKQISNRTLGREGVW